MRRYTALAAALACMAVAAPAAQADHVAPAVTATLELGKRVRDCDARHVCGGSRRATVGWTISCGPGLGEAAIEEVSIKIRGVRAGGSLFDYDGETFDSSAGFDGSLNLRAGPGMRFVGEVVVTCNVQVPTPDGDLVDHRGTARATTREAFLPPRLGGFGIGFGTWCGPLTGRERFMVAGEYFDLLWGLRYSAASLGRGVRLAGRGAGIRFRRSPSGIVRKNYGLPGLRLTPRRPGTLRIWAEIGGKRTNELRVRVEPKRC